MIQDFGEIEICLYKSIINGKLEEVNRIFL